MGGSCLRGRAQSGWAEVLGWPGEERREGVARGRVVVGGDVEGEVEEGGEVGADEGGEAGRGRLVDVWLDGAGEGWGRMSTLYNPPSLGLRARRLDPTRHQSIRVDNPLYSQSRQSISTRYEARVIPLYTTPVSHRPPGAANPVQRQAHPLLNLSPLAISTHCALGTACAQYATAARHSGSMEGREKAGPRMWSSSTILDL